MEDNANSNYFTFDSPKNQSSIIKVIGVGGGGGNAVNHMFRQGINGVDFIVCNTDMKALNSSPVPNKISIGELGAGNDPEVAKRAAIDHTDAIREALSHNTKMLFITAGMGGGTGTGAAPIIAEIAKSIDTEDSNIPKILTVAIVTLPFSFEGKRRLLQAQEGINELRRYVDSIIVINNDKLRTFGNLGISKAFALADDVLLTAAKGIAEIITNNAYINIDLKDVNTVMQHSGTALMGAGSGTGENRAHDAIEAATTSVLLNDNDISGAKSVLLYFSYSSEYELTMDEQMEVTDYILEKTHGTADFIWGAGVDESLGESLKVILIATGFEKAEGEIIEYVDDQEKQLPATSDETVTVFDENGNIIDKTTAKPEADKNRPSVAPASFAPILDKTLIEKPVLIKADHPAAAAAPEAAPAEEKGRIFTLEDIEALPPSKPVRNVRAGGQEFRTEIDATVGEEFTLVHRDTPAPEPAAPAPKPTSIHTPTPEVKPIEPFIDVAVAEIPAPKPAPVAATPTAQATSAIKPLAPEPANNHSETRGFSDRLAQDRMGRIRFIHEQLRNNPNGAEYVQSLLLTEPESAASSNALPSAEREVADTIISEDGTVMPNPYLWGEHLD